MNNKTKAFIGSLFYLIVYLAITIIPIIYLWDVFEWLSIPIWIGIEIAAAGLGFLLVKFAEWIFLK